MTNMCSIRKVQVQGMTKQSATTVNIFLSPLMKAQYFDHFELEKFNYEVLLEDISPHFGYSQFLNSCNYLSNEKWELRKRDQN